ncbi:MAG: DUF2262 domain-containing protein [Armatimonadota bacterium]|nr:DUF2262 domain-containing protein [Armatimonadota bacterium]
MAERTIHDETLGLLTWNSRLDWWEGRFLLAPGHPIGFSIGVEEDDSDANPTAEIQRTRLLLGRLPELEPEARQLAADELLDIYNEEWNDDAPLSAEEFMARLTLDDIGIAPDGSAELFYQDDGLFAGHAVLVSLDADGNLDDADIAG